MKISYERVGSAETVTGINEYSGLRAHRYDTPVLVGGGLKDSAGGRADRDDPAPGPAAGVDDVGGLRGYMKELAVHMMLLDPVAFDRTEGAEPDVERHLGITHAHPAYLGE